MYLQSNLSEYEQVRLESCLDYMKSTLGNSFERSQMVDALLIFNFNTSKAINHLLTKSDTSTTKAIEKKDKGDYTTTNSIVKIIIIVFFMYVI